MQFPASALTARVGGPTSPTSLPEVAQRLASFRGTLIMSVFDLSYVYDKHVLVTGASAGIGAATVRYCPCSDFPLPALINLKFRPSCLPRQEDSL
jgi:hypothetical protein